MVFEKFREVGPSYVRVHPFLAAALVADGQAEAARAILREIQAIDPSLRVADVLRPYPMRDAEPRERLAVWLAEAGLPA